MCGNRFTEWATHYCKIQGNTLAWDERLNIPLRPMIGVIGVAPEGEPVNCGTPGSHGGNMDNTAITTGRHAVLPRGGRWCAVRLRRHARSHGRRRGQRLRRRGCGYATVTLTAMPELKLVNPLIENDTHFGIIVSAESLDAAAELAVQQMVDLLDRAPTNPRPIWSCCCRWVADVQVCQMVDPQKTVRFMVPKYVLDAIGLRAVASSWET